MEKEEFDLIVIGSGPGGYVAAIKASQLGLKVACAEKYSELGGTCLNVGCIPSKSLLHSSEFYHQMMHRAKSFGIEASSISLNYSKMMEKKEGVVKGFNQGIASLFKKNKVTRLEGLATFINPHEIEVAGKRYSSKSFIIATGSRPIGLPFLPFNKTNVISSTEMLSSKTLPKKLIVVGAGVIGVELGSVYQRLGVEVTFVEFLDRICPTCDLAVSHAFQKILEKQGLKFHLNAKVVAGVSTSSHVELEVEMSGKKEKFEADKVLIAIGRKPFTEGLGLERIGITLTPKGFIPIDDQFRTTHSHILAIGDVVEGPMLAHKAEEEGIAAAELLSGHLPKVEYMLVPSVVYTSPEVASVGLTEEEVKAKGIRVKISQFPFKANSRARCMGEEEGFVKMIAEEKTLQILGVHILGAHASELIGEMVMAMSKRMTAKEVAATFHAHPTLSEAIKEAALSLESKPIHM